MPTKILSDGAATIDRAEYLRFYMFHQLKTGVTIAIMTIASLLTIDRPIIAIPKPTTSPFAVTAPIVITGRIINGSANKTTISCNTISVNVSEYLAIPPSAAVGANGRTTIIPLYKTTAKNRANDSTCEYQITFMPSQIIPPTAKRYIDIAVTSSVKPPASTSDSNTACDYSNGLRLHEKNPIPVTLDFTLTLTCASG
jgi:hypothetical protein